MKGKSAVKITTNTNLFANRINGRLLAAAALVTLVTSSAFGANGPGMPALRAAKHPAHSRNPNPAVVPIQSIIDHALYGYLSGRFWQWSFSLPVNGHPLFPPDGNVDCSIGQSGHVWFLGGTFDASGQAVRTCTVPSSKWLFFPIINTECSRIDGDNLGDESLAGLQQCATSIQSNPTTYSASIDGVPVINPARYRVISQPFLFGPLPDGNIFQYFGLTAPAGTRSLSVSDGVHLLLYPLSPGAHTIKFYGKRTNDDGSEFVQDITYHLFVTR